MTTQAVQVHSAHMLLRKMFSMNHSLLTKNLGDVTEELALSKPGAGNAIAWSLGHIVYWRQAVITMLGGTPVWAEGEAEGFKGTSREFPATIDGDWPTLVKAYRESHTRLMSVLGEQSDPTPEALEGASQLQCHEAYHIGQIALARRVVGLPGAL